MILLASIARFAILGTAIGYLALLLTSTPCQALEKVPRWHQLETVTFRHVSTEHGLPVGPVLAVSEDKRGLIWIASAGGLYRWDGHHARRFRTEDTRVHEDLHTLARAPDDSLWLGGSVGVTRLDPVTGEVTPLESGEDLGAVVNIAFDQKRQQAWLSREGGISRLDLADGSATSAFQSVPDRVFQIRITEDGSVWAATEAGLLRRRADTPVDSFEPVALPGVAIDVRIASLAVANDGALYVGSARDGLFRIGNDGDITRPYSERFSGEWIYALAEIRPGVLWLGTYGQGVIELSQSGGWRSIRENRLIRESLASDKIWSINKDSAGRIWLGTVRGISVHDPTQTAIRHVFGDTGSDSVIRDIMVRSVFEDDQGQIWLGLDQSGVDIIDPTKGRVTEFDADSEKPRSHLPRGATEAIASLDQGHHLIGSNWGLYEARNGQLQRIDAEGLPERQYVGVLAVDTRGVLAGGTNGLWRLQHDNGRWRARRVEAALSDQRVSSLLSLPDGSTVVGTWAGVNWLDENDRLIAQTLQPGPDSPFANGFVSSLRLGPDQRLWIASDAGLYRIDAADAEHSMVRLTAEDGLPGNTIRALEFDHLGRAWVATTKGLAVIDTNDLSVAIAATPAEGMTAPFFRNASTHTSAGELVFGGDGGITVVAPDQWRSEPIYGPVATVNVMVDDQRLLDESLGRTATDPVIMPAGSTRLAVEFASLTYAIAPPSRYRYRLHGFDPDWRHTDKEHRTASYTTLTPGKYRLEVQSENGLGGWSESGQTLHIQVLPTWYQHRLSRLLGLLLIACLLYGLFRWRTYHLHQHQHQLETLVAQRTRELEATTATLHQKSQALERASVTTP